MGDQSKRSLKQHGNAGAAVVADMIVDQLVSYRAFIYDDPYTAIVLDRVARDVVIETISCKNNAIERVAEDMILGDEVIVAVVLAIDASIAIVPDFIMPHRATQSARLLLPPLVIYAVEAHC